MHERAWAIKQYYVVNQFVHKKPHKNFEFENESGLSDAKDIYQDVDSKFKTLTGKQCRLEGNKYQSNLEKNPRHRQMGFTKCRYFGHLIFCKTTLRNAENSVTLCCAIPNVIHVRMLVLAGATFLWHFYRGKSSKNEVPRLNGAKYINYSQCEIINVLHYFLRTFEPGHTKTCQMPYANNKAADQPAHPHSLIGTFAVRCLDSIMYILALSKVSRL